MRRTQSCGYSCGDEKANLQGIIDRTLEYAKENPQWGEIMLGKFMEMVYDARLHLPEKLVEWNVQTTSTRTSSNKA